MRTTFTNSEPLVRFQKILIPSFGLLFIGALYILFVEIAHKLNWSDSVFVLMMIVITSFGVSYTWATIEYIKIRMLMEKIKLVESEKEFSIKHKLNLLSFKEKEVLHHILSGKSNKEISASLFIEHCTLKSHINHIYKKLEVRTRKEMVLAVK